MTSPFAPKRLTLIVAGLALLAAPTLRAQDPAGDSKAAQDSKTIEPKPAPSPRGGFTNTYPADWSIKTYYLRNVATQNDANEILVALRNVLTPMSKLFLVASNNAIVVYTSPDQQQVSVNLIHDLDRPKQTYKLTYTFTEYDAGKRVGIQHHSLGLMTGQRTTFKEGSKIPVLTGSTSTSATTAQSQFQYIDVGLNLDATIDPYAGGIRLRTKVEESSSAEDKSISGVSEPVIRQSVFEGVAAIMPGKSTMLGSIEVTGTTRRIDIEVSAEPLS